MGIKWLTLCCAGLSALANRLPTGIPLTVKKFVKADQRSEVSEHKVLRQRQHPTTHAELLEYPSGERASVATELGQKENQINARIEYEKGRAKQNRNQEERHKIAQHFVREELNCIETAAKRIQHCSMSPKVGESLRDDPHAHPQLFVGPAVCFFGADGARLVDSSQALFDHLGGDDEVAACFVI